MLFQISVLAFIFIVDNYSASVQLMAWGEAGQSGKNVLWGLKVWFFIDIDEICWTQPIVLIKLDLVTCRGTLSAPRLDSV